MSRGIFSTFGQWLYNASAQVSSGPVFVAAWVYPLAGGGVQTIWGVTKSTVLNVWVRLYRDSSDHVGMQVKEGAALLQVVSTGTLTIGAWNFVAGYFHGSQWLHVWLGDQKNTQSATGTYWPSGLDATALGVRYSSTKTQAFNGYIGPLARWSNGLADAAVIALANGLDYRSQKAADLENYYEMIGTGGATDLIGSFDFTEQGAVGEQDNPPIRRCRRRVLDPFFHAGAA